MKHIFSLLLFVMIISNAMAQKNTEGYFTTEAATVATSDRILVSIKKYNPTAEQIMSAASPSKNTPMTYLQIPAIATGISMTSNDFESLLYSLDKTGAVQWVKTTGFSKYSVAAPVAESNDFVYAGAGAKDDGTITLYKYDKEGKEIWSKSFDSLDNVNSIAVFGNKVNALVSFDLSEKVEHKRTFSYHVYPIYFFLQLDATTGAVIKKEYQMMGNYLSSIGYGNAYVNSNASYYLHNKDSALYLSLADQKSGKVVSENMSKENEILLLTAGPSENHYLTIANAGSKKAAYELVSDFFGEQKKYNSTLSIKPGRSGNDRNYLLQNAGDSMITVLAQERALSVCYTDKAGKSDCSTKENFLKAITAGAGLYYGKPYVICISGRDKPGSIGKLELVFY